jgi:cytochrome c oxidase subunit 2
MERLARIVTAALILGSIALFEVKLAGWLDPVDDAIDLVARQPDAGGWSRERIVVKRGQRVRLRICSEDVIHGFAVGRLGVDVGPIEPGKVTTVEFMANTAGEFTYYCTTWCDPNHPRMRGVLEVRDPDQRPSLEQAAASDTILQHLDEPRMAQTIPAARPSAVRGARLYTEGCARCHGDRGKGVVGGPAVDWREALLERSPVQIHQRLTGEVPGWQGDRQTSHPGVPTSAPTDKPPHAMSAKGWRDQDRWDAVAYLWSMRTSPDRPEIGERLYARNCAPCHGERGAGDGPGGRYQPKKPADFTDASKMMAGTTALYTAKIRRGGMGTGMPYWGNIFTEGELSALVERLWSFTMDIRREDSG